MTLVGVLLNIAGGKERVGEGMIYFAMGAFVLHGPANVQHSRESHGHKTGVIEAVVSSSHGNLSRMCLILWLERHDG
jgi:hypothetical protein